jgi:hypothetical protein
MRDLNFTRPDLCSRRATTEQEELAEAFRGRFSAHGYPLADDEPPAPLGRRHRPPIRLSSAAAVLAVAGLQPMSPTGTPALSSGHTARPGSPPG